MPLTQAALAAIPVRRELLVRARNRSKYEHDLLLTYLAGTTLEVRHNPSGLAYRLVDKRVMLKELCTFDRLTLSVIHSSRRIRVVRQVF